MTTLTVDHLTKRYGDTVAVDDLSFVVRPGTVTGFLGPNGAGKTTTLRMLLGLARPTSGRAVVDGARYRDLDRPATTVGAMLETDAFHPGRTGRNHLRVLAAAAGLDAGRVDEVLAIVGLTDAADRRTGGYSLGMRQRLGLAAALLGDPQVLILDEPANGLDPQGIRWLRDLLRHYAAGGATVLVSSHVLTEMSLIADEVVVISRGRLVTQASVEMLTSGESTVTVALAEPDRLADLLTARGASVQRHNGTRIEVHGMEAPDIGRVALDAGLALHELTPHAVTLEDVFLDLTDSLA